MSRASRKKSVLDRYRAYLNEATDSEVLAIEVSMENLRASNPLVYRFIEPVWLERLKKAKEAL